MEKTPQEIIDDFDVSNFKIKTLIQENNGDYCVIAIEQAGKLNNLTIQELLTNSDKIYNWLMNGWK